MSANSSEAAVTAAGDLSVPRVRKYWVLAFVSLTIFMVWVDSTGVNTALPSIANQAFVDAMRISMFTAIGSVAIALAIAVIAIPGKVREHQAQDVET